MILEVLEVFIISKISAQCKFLKKLTTFSEFPLKPTLFKHTYIIYVCICIVQSAAHNAWGCPAANTLSLLDFTMKSELQMETIDAPFVSVSVSVSVRCLSRDGSCHCE